jgi:phospholipase/carboxylesterase
VSTRSLEHDVLLPAKPVAGAPVFVLLHGRGADRTDLAGLRSNLPAEAMLVLPEGPFQGAQWGYGGGWAWYQFMGRNRPEPNSFEESLDALDALLGALPGLLPVRPGPIVLGGFSQGGTVSLAYALAHPGKAPLVLNFSGFLADHSSVRVAPETVAFAQIFWGHGKEDPNIPFALAVEGRAMLDAAGARLTARDYTIGHWIDPVELTDAMDWVRERI